MGVQLRASLPSATSTHLFTSTAAPIANSAIWVAHNSCSGMRSRKPRGIRLPNSTWGAAIVTILDWSRSKIDGALLGQSWRIFDILLGIPTALLKQRKLALVGMSGLMRQAACLLLQAEPSIDTWDSNLRMYSSSCSEGGVLAMSSHR